jgi:Terpene synthase family 2, C-terminal metal binding
MHHDHPSREILLQDVHFRFPVPCRISPDLDGAYARSLDWIHHHGLATSADFLDRYKAIDLVKLAAYAYPYARGAALDLAADLMTVWFIADDQFDGPINQRPDQAAQACENIIAIFHGEPSSVSSHASPIVMSFTDVWARCVAGMPQSWRARAEHNWELFFSAPPYEAAAHLSGRVPDRNSYLLIRRLSDGMDTVMDMCERIGGFHVPVTAFHSPPLQAMRKIVRLVPAFCNDLYSLAKEEPLGHVTNIVLVIEQERRCSRQAAVQEVCRMINEQLDHFTQLQTHIPQIGDLLGLRPEQRHALDRYVESIALFMSGYHQWELETFRYSGEAAGLSHHPEYTENLF